MDTDGATLHPAARPSTPASATTPDTAAGSHAERGGGGGGGAARWARGRCACEGEAQAQAADDDEGQAAAYRRCARLQPRPPPRAHCPRRRTRVPGLALAALLGALLAAGAHLNAATTAPAEDPEFTEQIENITVPAGRNVKLACSVKNLGTYKVAWMHFEQSAILTVHNHVITRNPRISVSHDKHRTWFLHISNVQEEDKGRYMCQINTVTAKTQFGFLHVVVERESVARDNHTARISQGRDARRGRNEETKKRTRRNAGEALIAKERKRKAEITRRSTPCLSRLFQRVPPNIDDSLSSSDVIVREGANVTLTCHATGSPPPSVKWKRDDGSKIAINKSTAVLEWEGEVLEMTRISRLDMGAYLCIASNGVPPTVSKRIKVSVDFPPMLWIPHQLVGAPLGYSVVLECFTEAHPTSLNYWTRDDGHMIHESRKYRADNTVGSPSYKTHMKLTINSIQERDYGTYKCVAKNPRGETDGTIRLYTSAPPSTTPGPTSTDLPRRNPDQQWEGAPEANNSVYNPNLYNGLHGDKGKGSKYQSNLNEIDKSEQKSAFDSSGKGVVYEWPQPDAGAGGGARGLRACGCGGAGLALALALPVAALGLGMAHSRAPAPAR